MAETPWWQEGVVYQVYPRSFKDSNGDGVGDLRGITEKLGYLSGTLGVDAVWISPFYPSPMKDFGYDVSDYTDVDPLFGTLKDFDELVEEAHRRGLKVLLDYVPSHTSDEHPWFVESRSSRDNPKRDWYVWRDPKPNGSPPNNWVEETGGSVWEFDEGTGQYYLHSHYASQPDLNWRNGEVREEMFGVLRFWLERGADGFRIDVAHMIMKDPELRDNPPNPNPKPNPYDRQHPNFHSQLHVHDRQHPDLHGVYREIRKLLGSYGEDRVMIGEIETSPWDSWTLYYGENLDEFQMPFNFRLIETPWEAKAVRAFVDSFEGALPEGAWPNYVLGNHDRPRLATRYGIGQARVAAMLLLTLRGTPTLYQGDEIGMRDADVPPEKMQDPLGRDPTRTPMQWDASTNAGFCPEGAAPCCPSRPTTARPTWPRNSGNPDPCSTSTGGSSPTAGPRPPLAGGPTGPSTRARKRLLRIPARARGRECPRGPQLLGGGAAGAPGRPAVGEACPLYLPRPRRRLRSWKAHLAGRRRRGRGAPGSRAPLTAKVPRG